MSTRRSAVQGDVGLADLILARTRLGEAGLREAAAFLHYKVRDERLMPTDILADQVEPVGKDQESVVSPMQCAPRRPPHRSIPFWRTVAITSAEAGDDTEEVDQVEILTEGQLSREPRRVQPPPRRLPLRPWARLGPELFRRTASTIVGELDADRFIDQVAGCLPIAKLPRRTRTQWPQSPVVIVDRSRRLAPVWDDQEQLQQAIDEVCGGVIDSRWLPFGVVGEVLHKGRFVRRALDDVVPGTSVVALTDLGFHSTAEEQRAWQELGSALIRRGANLCAVVPCVKRRWVPEIAATWNALLWDRPGPGANGATARLLTLAAAGVRVESGLLRALRLALPASETDVSSEIEAWRHPNVAAVEGGDTISLSWDARERGRSILDARTGDRRAAVRQLAQWHATLPREIWFAELLALTSSPEECAAFGLDPEEWRAARAYFMSLAKTLDGDSLASPARDGVCVFFREVDWASERHCLDAGLSAALSDLSEHARSRLGQQTISRRARVGARGDATRFNVRQLGGSLTVGSDEGGGHLLGRLNGALDHLTVLVAGDLKSRRVSFPDAPLPGAETQLDREVVRRFVGGDQKAFRAVYDAYAHRVLRYLGIVAAEAAQDLMQETFLRVYRSAPQYDSTRPLGQWILHLARLRAAEYLRGKESGKDTMSASAEQQTSARSAPSRVEITSNAEPIQPLLIDAGHQAMVLGTISKPAWANAVGRDRWGLWADVTIPGSDRSVTMRLRWIPPGQIDDPEIFIERGYWLADTPCTQELWTLVTGHNPSAHQAPHCPVERVSMHDVDTFIASLHAVSSDLRFRLPTDDEWGFAARAFGPVDVSDVDAVAWHHENSRVTEAERKNWPFLGKSSKLVGNESFSLSQPVRLKEPNAFGLFDVFGNVWEYCAAEDPDGLVLSRGGSFRDAPGRLQLERFETDRAKSADNLGFRFAADDDLIDPTLLAFSTFQSVAASSRFKGRPDWAVDAGEDEYGHWAMAETKGVKHRYRWIPSGTFMMGSPEDEEGRYRDEGPQHQVTISRGFWLGETPCRQDLWEVIVGDNPSLLESLSRPVEQVSWNDVRSFLSALQGSEVGRNQFRLPTEAEWEYACRAGTIESTYAGGHAEESLHGIAWYSANSRSGTAEVKKKAPNSWGLHDMLGNVFEWCADCAPVAAEPESYSAEPRVDPKGPEDGGNRVIRGGSWYSDARYCRAAFRYANPRDYRNDGLGFRLSRSC